MVGAIMNDFRLALRSVARSPGYATIAVLTLALGIGATTAIFSAVNGVLMRPLPYPDDGRLMMLWYNNVSEGIERDVASYPMFEDWRATASFRVVAGFTSSSATFTGERPAEEYAGAWVTEDFFQVLGVQPAFGRVLGATHTRAGDDRVVVLSERLRTAWFGEEDPTGRRIDVNGVSREIIGVMPREFVYPAGADYWLPIAMDSEPWRQFAQVRDSYWLTVIGRLADGYSAHGATAELDAVMARLIADGLTAPGDRVFVEPLRDALVGSVRPAMAMLAGAVALVLLIACANMANLLLARGASRQREFAVRSALGARGRRLAGQALVESLVLGAVGGVLGLVVAYAGTAAIVTFSPADIPRLDNVRVDATVITFALLAAAVTGLVFGLAPAWQARAVALAPGLRAGGRSDVGGGLSRLRPALVVFEVALALVLLIGAGLLLRSFTELQSVDPGFRTERVLSFRVAASAARYPEPEQVRQFQAELVERIDALPGVESVAAIYILFLDRLPNMGIVSLEGQPPPLPGEPVIAVTNDFVSHNFFDAMDVPLVSGRTFESADVADGVQVVVVNETFVRRLLPGEDPLGRRFTRGDPSDPEAIWLTIVGVVADTRRAGLAEPVRPEAYRPLTQASPRSIEVLAQTAVPPLTITPLVRELVQEIDPNVAVSELRTVEGALADALATRRFVMVLFAGFAALALTLAVVGLYGVLAFLVAQRRREIGLRMAIGAGHREVTVMVLRQSLRYVLPGIALGTLVALVLTRVLDGQLHAISPTDPATFAAVATLLVAAALLASWVPARRATRTDPMEVLREE
jgi:putative ABC transport system permease protein